MKTMTCAEMGGPCATEIHGKDAQEMMDNGMAHIRENHPEMAKDIESMPKDDPKMVAWYEKFMKDFADKPEDK